MEPQEFKTTFWLHSHARTKEFLEFDLLSVEGNLHRDILDYILCTAIMYDDIVNQGLDKKDLLEKPLEASCCYHWGSVEAQEEPWLEFLSVEEK